MPSIRYTEYNFSPSNISQEDYVKLKSALSDNPNLELKNPHEFDIAGFEKRRLDSGFWGTLKVSLKYLGLSLRFIRLKRTLSHEEP